MCQPIDGAVCETYVVVRSGLVSWRSQWLTSDSVILPDEAVDITSIASIGNAAVREIGLPELRICVVSAGQSFSEMIAMTQRSRSIGGEVTRTNQIGIHVVDRV